MDYDGLISPLFSIYNRMMTVIRCSPHHPAAAASSSRRTKYEEENRKSPLPANHTVLTKISYKYVERSSKNLQTNSPDQFDIYKILLLVDHNSVQYAQT